VTVSRFSDLGLADPIQHALKTRKHIVPTPIQAQAIPELLAGKDILGIAQTGTGKTAAFALPILHKLSRNHKDGRRRHPRALILAPTRELAAQIGGEFAAYGARLHLRQIVIFGGVNQRPQVAALARGVDIVVATPGRFIDLLGQRRVSLGEIQFLVLDEADRMLDMGFIRDIRKIVAALPKRRQSLLFSATMPAAVARIAGDILTDPVRVEVTPQATPVANIEQHIYHVDAAAKRALLNKVLADPSLSRVIVFARTKHRANRVAEQLGKTGVVAEAIHGNKSQGARERALQRFRSGGARVLVATDIVARGIDVTGVTHIINYELPNEPEAYIHRIGRTARAGASGAALSFCDATERGYLRDIEHLIQKRLTVVGDEPSGPVPATRGRSKASRGKPRQKGGRPAKPRNHKRAFGPGTPRRRRRTA
jgi:ATP-dependent RNA helicase RhlE